MKTLFKKIILFLSVLYSITFSYITFFPMYYNSIDNIRWYYFKQIFENKIRIEESKILFLGDSRLETNVDVKKIPNSWTFAAGGSSPIEMYYCMKHYIKNYSNPDTVFISFSPRTLIQAYSFWGYAVRNHYFTTIEFKQINSNLQLFPADTVLGNYPVLNYLLYKFNYIEYHQDDLSKNYVFLAKKDNEMAIKHFQVERGAWVYPNLKNGCSELNFETKLKSFNPSRLLDFYFLEILNLCKKRNIHVIFDFMPMNETSYQKLNQNFVLGYKSYIQKMASQFPEFTFSDTVYCYNDQYFGDASHLNSIGKEQFTKYLCTKYFK